MAFWNRKATQIEEIRETLEEILLSSNLATDTVSKEQALNIPAVAACVNLISNTVASLPIHLFKSVNGEVTVVDTDNRVSLLNDDTKDTLDGYQFKKAVVEDFILTGSSYVYINRNRNNFKSLHYIDPVSVSVIMNTDPIFKDYKININGVPYRDFEFIKVTRKTKNGVVGQGVIAENNKLLSVVYNALVFEETLVKTGGNKKGFLKAQNRISQESINALKTAWANLYKNNTENVVVLNNGLEFQEASNTSVELQLNQNKITNSSEICKIFNVPVNILEGSASEEEYNNFIKVAVLPILKAIETALNKNLLLDKEKGSFYFGFDTSELLKGDLEKRYKAYEIGVKNGILQVDEVRYKEDLPPLGLDFIKLGLQDVLYDVKSKTIYTPNTNKVAEIGDSAIETEETEPKQQETQEPALKEVNDNESGDSEQPSNS